MSGEERGTSDEPRSDEASEKRDKTKKSQPSLFLSQRKSNSLRENKRVLASRVASREEEVRFARAESSRTLSKVKKEGCLASLD